MNLLNPSYLFICFALFGCKPTLETVKNLDVNQYLGRWYEIARLPFRYEKGLVNVTAEYSLLNNMKIQVLNSGYKDSPRGDYQVSKGIAHIPDAGRPGLLKVKFFGIFSSNYQVIALDTVNYNYAMVTSGNGKYFWILSRTSTMDETLFNHLIEKANSMGINTDNLIKTLQQW